MTAVAGLEGYLLLASGNRIETLAVSRWAGAAGAADRQCCTARAAGHAGLLKAPSAVVLRAGERTLPPSTACLHPD